MGKIAGRFTFALFGLKMLPENQIWKIRPEYVYGIPTSRHTHPSIFGLQTTDIQRFKTFTFVVSESANACTHA